MAKLVAVCRDDEFPFERRQIPLMIEETLTMVMEIPETVISADCVTSVDVSQFVKKYSCLTNAEMTNALMVRQKDLFSLLAVSVPCVGCRRSVERLYNQLWQSGQPALEPLTICASGVLTLSDSFLVDAKLIYALFYIHGTHLNDVVDTIPKSKRNKRCILHSLETHKAARASGWMDVWDLLSQECRDEVVLIDSDSLLDTLETYLRKHRFCSECKSKVLKAYSILAGDTDGDSEKGYCATLYEGLKSCPKDRHIHVVCDTDFIAHLIGRAEPELAGGRRERHARTIDIAQEEVLTCLGIHLWERLHRLWQKLRAEEQTWQILFYLGVEALRKRFETAVEEKQGISQLELVVEEISEAEKAKVQRRENKRLKRKKRKENKAKLTEEAKLEDEKSEKCTDEKESISEETVASSLEIEKESDDCSSEKSSTDSQISPGKSEKSDLRSATPPTPSKISPCSSPVSDTSYQSLLKPVIQSDEKPATCSSTLKGKSKCNTGSSCETGRSGSCSKAPLTPKKASKCHEEDPNSPPWLEASSRKGSSNSDSCRNGNSGKENVKMNGLARQPKDCECDSSSVSKSQYKQRNGYYLENQRGGTGGVYKNGQYKRNGYNECRNGPTVGPRFSRYENQNRWKETVTSPGTEDCVNEVTCTYGANGRGRGTGKRGKVVTKCKDTSTSILTNSHWGNMEETNNTTNHQSHTKSNHHPHRKNGDNHFDNTAKTLSNDVTLQPSPEVEDENELRLLKMMGWSNKAEDSICLSEQEIQEYKASKLDVQSRRQELRDKLRDQFQKLCVNHMANGCRVCDVCT